jgi:Protein of unknown function (DUF3226)
MRWPSLGRPIEAPKQLLVEGRTPEIFFREWVEAMGLKGQLEVRDYLSLNDLTPFLRLFTGYKDFRETVTSLAVVRDAEEQPASSAFDSVCAALAAVNLPCPGALASFSPGMPRIGIFVLPDCRSPGMLETLCWSVLQADSKSAQQLECVTAYLACLRRIKAEIRNETKARVWAYLAGKGHFDPQVGRAAQAKVWDWQSPALQPLSAFLKSL